MRKHLFLTTSLIAFSLLFVPFHRSGFAQSNQNNPNNTQENIEQAGENLQDAGQNLLEATDEATTEAQQQLAETANAVEQKANWGWLGLLGLLGLFGLAGKGKTKVIHHHDANPNVIGKPSRDY